MIKTKTILFILLAFAIFYACDNGTIPEGPATTGNSSPSGGTGSEYDPSLSTEQFPYEYGIEYDASTSVVFNGPLHSGIAESEDSWGIVSTDEMNANIDVTGYNETVPDYSYPYKISATGDVSPAGVLSARSDLFAAGFNLDKLDEYQVFGNARHDVDFKAVSDAPNTTRVNFTVSVTFTGSADFSWSTEYVVVFSSMSLSVKAYPMGWRMSEMGGQEYAAAGEVLTDQEGYAVVGYDVSGNGIIQSNCSGWFLGEVTPGSEVANIDVTRTTDFETSPDQIVKLYLSIMARSIAQFAGMRAEYSCSATGSANISSVSWSVRAEDPDNPDAEVTVVYYTPYDYN